ncbi:TonB-dependent siderophore receptor [Hyphomicrobium sp. ghe19]|uniref:TonB-dependent receptor n=1 Tax=Hyphomicrobium sp. ghe19 TaxID=2682968 RepID=UPI00136739AA|nr:Ferrichrome-iron receptor [Hyphomicrobium sp. ghe19]
MLRTRTALSRRAVGMLVVFSSTSSVFAVSTAALAEEEKPAQLPAVTVDVGNHGEESKAKKGSGKTSVTKAASIKARPKEAVPTGSHKISDGASPPSSNNLGTANDSVGGSPARGLEQVPALGKTGTPLGNLPASVQIIPKKLLNEQGATTLQQAVTNASGINAGGQDSLGYFDHFLIRGLNAQVYSDGFSDGDQLGGLSHSLNGVQGIEIQEGPGSALFGSGPPGGTINILHYKPSSEFHYGDSLQVGSFGTITDNFFVTGPSTLPGLDYRVDATVSHSDGFRDLESQDYEIRPDFIWHFGDHTFEFALDARHLDQTPDSYGLIYFKGQPITGVPIDAKYSTPFADATQDFLRPTFADSWNVNDFLTVNNRFSYLYRTLDAVRNGDSTRTFVCTNPATQKDPVTGKACIPDQVVGRQLRQQSDTDNDLDYQFEPVWKFSTGAVSHTLLTGFEVQHETLSTSRSTADLPNIADAFAPVPPETSLNGLTFKCDASHSCDDDHLAATYLSLYATDQIDVTDRWKIRAGVRKDWWDTTLDPQITVPGRFTSEGTPLVAGVTQERDDAPVSWNVGTLYKLFPGVSPYFGVSESHLTNFNSENTQNGIGAPESAFQYEAGIKFSMFDGMVVLNTAAFTVSRDNVATATTINGVEGVVFDSQRTKGVEASVDAKITDQWHVLANMTAQDAVITANPQAITSVGNHPQGVPPYMANLWTTYQFSIAGVRGFQVGAGLNYRDVTFSDITNKNSVPSYVIGNAMLGYEAQTWGVTLDVDNITDERYFVAANGAGAFVGNPLSAFVNIHFKE